MRLLLVAGSVLVVVGVIGMTWTFLAVLNELDTVAGEEED
jgi:hypothetical protein